MGDGAVVTAEVRSGLLAAIQRELTNMVELHRKEVFDLRVQIADLVSEIDRLRSSPTCAGSDEDPASFPPGRS